MVEYHKEYTPAESSVIRELRYQPNRQVLEVRIEQPSGEERVYFYEEVPEGAYIDFVHAHSKGRYYNRNIKGVYETFSRE